MLRTNLSTRPFYNERAVHLVLSLAGVLLAVVTAFNLVEVVELSRANTELSARVSADRNEATRLSGEAAKIRRGINQDELKLIVDAAQEANVLIDRRTFSWTSFFNHIEATLPPDVMLTSVRPIVDPHGTRITMIVLGRDIDDIDEFADSLDATGVFADVLARQQDFNEAGLARVVFEVTYVPARVAPTRGNGGDR
ncbi:MAG TPA: hypothetical protein VLD67_21175 [Vicinamibacterales bacterium]|nr:hypothetical protein [Vicinamibacterales bacterium]